MLLHDPPLTRRTTLLGAAAIGAASLPILARFMRDRELLFRSPGETRLDGANSAERLSAS